MRKVRFVGRRDPLPYYAAADAFLFPTSFDPLSNVTLEAMACGLVVIIGKNDGASELLVDGRDGFVLEDSRNVPEITGILDKVADPRSRSGFRARAGRAVQRFTWERHFERLSCIFDRVLSEKSGGQTGSAKERVFAEA